MNAWKQLRGEIRTATKFNFERLALALLRLYWPDLIRPPEGDQLDRAGIDLASGVNGTHVARVVQCKGFHAADSLTDSGLRQIRHSVDSFLKSPFTCGEYVLFHNRDSRDRVLAAQVKAELNRITASGKGRRTRVWDVQTFVRDYSKALRAHLAEELARHSQRQLAVMERTFDFGSIYVPEVPVSEQRLVLTRGELPRVDLISAAQLREPAKLVGEPADTRWTLLIGLYGTGKSTAAMRAARDRKRMVIYARCAELNMREGSIGTNILMEAIIRSLGLFEEFDEEGRERLLRLSSTILRAVLTGDDADALLILDGLDENRQYATAKGIVTLSSVLAELRCPILLTTREEHFNATFANFDTLLEEHSLKGGSSRVARIYRLEPWRDDQVTAFLEKACAENGGGSAVLRRLLQRLGKGQVGERELALLRHPLFLQMITALAVNGEESGTSGAEVLGRWTTLKMKRDLKVNRLLPEDIWNIGDYVAAMHEVLGRVAAAMVDRRDGGAVLNESVPEPEVLAAMRQSFPDQRQTLLTATSASLLVSTGPRRDAAGELMFSHRLFQEYYLARHLSEAGASWEDYPIEVAQLCRELVQARGGDPARISGS